MSVVLGDVPPGAVAVGVPARIIERSLTEASGARIARNPQENSEVDNSPWLYNNR